MWRDKIRFLTHGAALLGVSLLLSYLEAMLVPAPLPGVKLGLANIVVVYAAYRYSMGTAAAVSLARILLTFFLFGGGVSLLFSLSGGITVLLLLWILRRLPPFCSYIGISVLCAAVHTMGQLCRMLSRQRGDSTLVWRGAAPRRGTLRRDHGNAAQLCRSGNRKGAAAYTQLTARVDEVRFPRACNE